MYEILNNRTIIKIIGGDSVKFLQNLVTNNINKNMYCYTYLLNNQGRYLFDFFVYFHTNTEIYIDIDTSNKKALIDHLNFYKLRSKLEIIDCSEEYKIIYSRQQLDIDSLVTVRDPRYSKLGFRAIVCHSRGNVVACIPTRHCEERSDVAIQKNNKKCYAFLTGLLRQLLCNFLAMTKKSIHIYLEDKYNFAIIDGAEDLIIEKSIPNMYGAEELNAISFDKGCYVGQEVISRTKYQGVIRRKIYKVTANEDLSSLLQNEEVLAGNDPIGIICSAYQNKAIALIREEKYSAYKEANITVRGIKIDLFIAPWY